MAQFTSFARTQRTVFVVGYERVRYRIRYLTFGREGEYFVSDKSRATKFLSAAEAKRAGDFVIPRVLGFWPSKIEARPLEIQNTD